jgi:tRNA pseudouridine55 synthase
MPRSVNGILLLDKPLDISSNGALQRVKRLFQAAKAGHTGSLDPLASGLLPICFGEATKFSQFLLESNKTYAVVAKLGEQTTTGDREGEVIATQPITAMNREKIQAIMQRYLGQSEQIPPMFSALKHKGKPLYTLARKGIEVERKPRPITIHSLDLTAFDGEHVHFTLHCSKGTYVRTLVEDMGRDLGCLAHVKELRRTALTPYTERATLYSLPSLLSLYDRGGLQALDACLLPVDTAVASFPAVKLSNSAAFYLRQGQSVRAPFTLTEPLVRLLSEDEQFLGVGEVLSDGRVKPHRLVA